MKRARRNHGFSLMELLVVIGILGVVSTLGLGVLARVYSLWDATTVRARLDDKAEHALADIRADVAEMLSAELSGHALRGVRTQLQQDDDRYWAVVFHDDRIIFPAHVPLGGDSLSMTPALVMYHVDRVTNTLIRTTGELYAGDIPDGAYGAVADGVLHFQVEYLDANAASGVWMNSWSEERHPSALRVTLVLQDPDRPFEQVARKAVIPVYVQ